LLAFVKALVAAAQTGLRLEDAIILKVGQRELAEEAVREVGVGFEPTPFRTSALSWRLRPLGHLTNFGLLLLEVAFSHLAR
jgi:hypothetical protein